MRAAAAPRVCATSASSASRASSGIQGHRKHRALPSASPDEVPFPSQGRGCRGCLAAAACTASKGSIPTTGQSLAIAISTPANARVLRAKALPRAIARSGPSLAAADSASSRRWSGLGTTSMSGWDKEAAASGEERCWACSRRKGLRAGAERSGGRNGARPAAASAACHCRTSIACPNIAATSSTAMSPMACMATWQQNSDG